MSRTALSVEGISKAFSKQPVLKNAGFTLEEGRVGGLIGPNGAGKTTLFSIIAGFLKPDAGRVKIFDEDIRSVQSLNGLLSVLPQDAQFQRSISIERQFFWYARSMGFDREGARVELRRVLDWVGLADDATQVSDALSHGMNKRMAIAQALIGAPKLILLDEPTAGLDPANARRIRDLIRSLRGKRTLLVSSHNLDEIADVCDYVIIIDRGEILRAGAPHSLVEQTPRVSFDLAEPLDGDHGGALDALRGVTGVTGVTLSEDRRTLVCELSSTFLDDPEVLCGVLRGLASEGLDFGEMTKGARLEEAFLELTREDRPGRSS